MRNRLHSLELVGVALLYAVCGGLSSFVFNRHFQAGWLIGVTFALLTALLLLNSPRKIIAAPLIIVLWLAMYLSLGLASFAVDTGGLWAAGLVGGLGVSLAVAIGYRKLRSVLYLPLGGVIGALAAFSFGTSLHSCDGIDPEPVLRVHLSFAIWQAAVGTYLYAVCAPEKKATQPNAH
jgi:hypothetical protein